jgi:hypothetical protein
MYVPVVLERCFIGFCSNNHTVKKSYRQPGSHSSNSLRAEIIKLFPPRESLVNGIPAGVRDVANPFFTVQSDHEYEREGV